MLKYLFLDIDGTLLHNENSSGTIKLSGEENFIHKETRRILGEIKKTIPVILISGRRRHSFLRVKDYIPYSAAILENGGIIYNNNLFFKIFDCESESLSLAATQLKKAGFYIEYGETLLKVQPSKSKKFLSQEDEEKVLKIIPDCLKIAKGEGLVRIIPKCSGKLNSAIFYLKKEKIGINDIIFIGNDENDIELLSVAGKAITFQNAHPGAVFAVKTRGKAGNGVIVDGGHKGIVDALKIIKENN